MFNYSNEVKWIRVTEVSGCLVWINLENVERIYPTSQGSAFEFADRIVETFVPFDKAPDLLGGTSNEARR